MNSVALRQPGIQPSLKRYAMGVLAALVALALRHLLAPLVGDQILYMILWPAVVFSSWYCGVGPALVTVATGVAGIWHLFLPHEFHAGFEHSSSEITNLVGFLAVSALIITMGESNRRARLREYRLAEESAAANAKFQAIFQQTTVFAGVMTIDGIVLDANQISLEMCGYRAEDVLGRHFWDTAWWRKSADVQEKIRAATSQAAAGATFREVLPYHCADGTERTIDFSLHPIRDQYGKIIFLHPTGVDITDLKTAEDNYRLLAETLEEQVQYRTGELEHRTQQLRELSRRLMLIQDHERRRIARELHDSAGQVLAALGMNMQTMVADAQSISPKLAKDAEENFVLTQQLSQGIRTMSYLLHPPLLDDLGLSAALEWYVRGLTERSGIDIRLDVPEKLSRLPGELELAVFRVIQECLTNIHRHSGSKTASIRLAVDAEFLLLEVADRGHGIPPERLSEIQSQGSGVGLQGMRERFRPYDGTMRIDSSPSGTTISVSFKIPGQPA